MALSLEPTSAQKADVSGVEPLLPSPELPSQPESAGHEAILQVQSPADDDPDRQKRKRGHTDGPRPVKRGKTAGGPSSTFPPGTWIRSPPHDFNFARVTLWHHIGNDFCLELKVELDFPCSPDDFPLIEQHIHEKNWAVELSPSPPDNDDGVRMSRGCISIPVELFDKIPDIMELIRGFRPFPEANKKSNKEEECGDDGNKEVEKDEEDEEDKHENGVDIIDLTGCP
ncbi:hypothetical protein B0T24DRAFT_685587 [Lasiosphaeria ovina]|uniref:Uncharacterized protein n=1 Tax=Lasiosphaeria ovina TaxID=92902 RepID=A0AAE0JS35_9PEZI|nr:hypothetical protein B0T24DRAFT_685587 [Lasiosphaeria ovina]